MFEPVDNAGKPLTAEYAGNRSHFEPLIEMMQIKGNSEVHRRFWPADEFATSRTPTASDRSATAPSRRSTSSARP